MWKSKLEFKIMNDKRIELLKMNENLDYISLIILLKNRCHESSSWITFE